MALSIISGGNEGEYQGDISIDHPDFGTIASPGLQQCAITVASVENNEYIKNSSNEIFFISKKIF